MSNSTPFSPKALSRRASANNLHSMKSLAHAVNPWSFTERETWAAGSYAACGRMALTRWLVPTLIRRYGDRGSTAYPCSRPKMWFENTEAMRHSLFAFGILICTLVYKTSWISLRRWALLASCHLCIYSGNTLTRFYRTIFGSFPVNTWRSTLRFGGHTRASTRRPRGCNSSLTLSFAFALVLVDGLRSAPTSSIFLTSFSVFLPMSALWTVEHTTATPLRSLQLKAGAVSGVLSRSRRILIISHD